MIDKDKRIAELEAEDKRLCDVISNLHEELQKYNQKVRTQQNIIGVQQDIINALIELVGIMND